MNKAIKQEMKKDAFDGVREKLMEMRQNLIRESKADIGHILNKDDKYNGVSDDGDFAEIACRDSLQVTKFTHHQTQLRAIEEALLRIVEGTYGTCADCDEKIAMGRLHAIPFALRCVGCQEMHEITNSESEE